MFDISMQRGVLSGSESLVVQFRRLQNTLFILAIPILYDLEIAAATFSRAVDSLCHGNWWFADPKKGSISRRP